MKGRSWLSRRQANPLAGVVRKLMKRVACCYGTFPLNASPSPLFVCSWVGCWNSPANEAGRRRARRRRSRKEIESTELFAALQVRLQIQEHAGNSPPAELPLLGGWDMAEIAQQRFVGAKGCSLP
jgi:hypothetical protein